jgi:hypothetical protein
MKRKRGEKVGKYGRKQRKSLLRNIGILGRRPAMEHRTIPSERLQDVEYEKEAAAERRRRL